MHEEKRKEMEEKLANMRKLEWKDKKKIMRRVEAKKADRIRAFDDHCAANNLSPITREGYLRCLRELASFVEKPFKRMNRDDINRFISVCLEKATVNSKNKYKIVLKAFFRWLYVLDKGVYPDCVKELRLEIEGSSVRAEDLLTHEDVKKPVNPITLGIAGLL